MLDKEKQEFLESFSIENLIYQVIGIAEKSYNGHFAILSFTTNYRVGFRTPDSQDFTNIKPFPTLKEALINAILYEPCWY